MALSAARAQAIFDRRVAAWLAEDVDGYLACWHDDCHLVLPGGRQIVGRAAYRTVVERAFAWAEPAAFDVHHLAVDGDVVLADWTVAVRRRGDGTIVTWDGLSVCGVDAGRIRWWREHHLRPVEP